MRPERAERIADIVEQALEVEIGQRGPLLVEAANSDAERLACYQKALPIRQNLLSQRSGDPKLRRSVALTFLKVGATNDPAKPIAVQNIKRSVEMLEALAKEDPNNERARREVDYAYYQLGNALSEAQFRGRIAIPSGRKISQRKCTNAKTRSPL